MTKKIVAFRNFAIEPKNYNTTLGYVSRKTLLAISVFTKQHPSTIKKNKPNRDGIISDANK
jgi:hypothetical protein